MPAPPGEVYDEWGNLTHKDGVKQGYYDEATGEWIREVYDEWGNLTYKDGEEQGYYDDESGEWIPYDGGEEYDEYGNIVVKEETPDQMALAEIAPPPPAQQQQVQIQVAAAADEATKAAEEATKAAAEAANAAAEASKNLMKGFSSFGGGIMGSLSAKETTQKQDTQQAKQKSFGLGGLGGFGFGGGQKQAAKSPGFSFGGLGFGNTASNNTEPNQVVNQETKPQEAPAQESEDQGGYYDEAGEWVPAAPGEVYDEWGNLTHKDGVEQGYYDEESGEWILYDEGEEYDEYGNVIAKEEEKTPEDVEMTSLNEAEIARQDQEHAPQTQKQSPETATLEPIVPEEPVSVPQTTDATLEAKPGQPQEVETKPVQDNGYYDDLTGEWVPAAPGEVYDEWGNLTSKDGIDQGYYDEATGEWVQVTPGEVYDEWGNLTHKDGVEQGYYDDTTGEWILYEEGEEHGDEIVKDEERRPEKSPEDVEMVPLLPEEETVEAEKKTAGFTARQRWLWAFDLVTKVMARNGTADEVGKRPLLTTADIHTTEFPGYFCRLKRRWRQKNKKGVAKL